MNDASLPARLTWALGQARQDVPFAPAADEIRALRAAHGLTQAQLAEALAVSLRSVENWEGAKATMSPATWGYALARIAGVRPPRYRP